MRGWDVKTVAAHLVSVVDDGFWAFQLAALRCGAWVAESTTSRDVERGFLPRPSVNMPTAS